MLKIGQISVIVFIPICLILCVGSVVAQSKVGTIRVPTIQWQNSPRSQALGGCSITLVDEQSQFYNPAAMGVFSLDNIIAFGFNTNTEAWPKNVNMSEVLKTWGLNFRILPFITDFQRSKTDYALSFAFGNNRVESSLRYTNYDYWEGENADPEGTFYAQDDWYTYSGSFAFRYGILTAGLGYTYKDVTENTGGVDYNGNCYDLGLIASLKIINTPRISGQPGLAASASGAIARSNIGSMTYGTLTYNFPEVSMYGLSGQVEYNNGRNLSLTFLPTFQYEVFDEEGHPKTKRFGLESGLNDAVFGRIGYIIDEFDNEDFLTFGFGVSLKGIYSNLLFPSREAGNQNNILTFLDIRFDFARSKLVPFEKTNFYHVSLSL